MGTNASDCVCVCVGVSAIVAITCSCEFLYVQPKDISHSGVQTNLKQFIIYNNKTCEYLIQYWFKLDASSCSMFPIPSFVIPNNDSW